MTNAAMPACASREMLKVVVPRQLTGHSIALLISGPLTRKIFTTDFTLKKPELISFQPTTVVTGNAYLTITGRNFSYLPGNNQVFINGLRADIVSFSATMLKVSLPSHIIPDKLTPYQASVLLTVIIGQQPVVFPENLVIRYRIAT